MKIVIVAVGSRGDVAPLTGLAVRLRAEGHDVAIATQQPFEKLVRGCGLEFRLIPGDMRAGLTSAGTGIKAAVDLAAAVAADIGAGILQATEGADVLLLQRMALAHGHLVAQARGIRAVPVELCPSLPTEEFVLPSMLGLSGSLGRWGNRALAGAELRLPTPFDGALKDFARSLGLRPAGLGAIRRRIISGTGPVLHGYSPALSPRPADWRRGAEVVGNWWPVAEPGWQPSPELTAFLAGGPPPVYVGFGSMVGERLPELVLRAVRRAGVRAVVQRGWAELSVDSDDVLTVDEVPHGWLFPRMAALVHHCGAGTTAAGVRAGKPVVGTPLLVDQPFWARTVLRAGVSPGWQPLRELTAEGLGDLISAAVTEPAYLHRAGALAARVRAEDGAGRTADLIRRFSECEGVRAA
ncbi:glycosyltransferase family 1 protein [Lentzea tibetensis]|uniref:Glycosyltransferase family 1 protein n=1 Tax=Lentzea tibetensis TaxID=2591470 RepID=A0A563EIZ4_9PSEU|nr:glycosyltransferase [Lentzea tibetensis]TWP46687.1 glycosyltransferase family 1 protein [Lentzea tibetensis]